jgi:cell division protein FtsW (lipid II flippase)
MESLGWKILFYFAVFVFALFMTVNGYSPILIVGVIFIVILLLFFLLLYYPLLLEKRIDRLESFLRKQKKTPAIYINFVLANSLRMKQD